MKPDIVFFGESLPGEFHRQMASDKDECDLLIVIGSSLKVRPVALIPSMLQVDSHVERERYVCIFNIHISYITWYTLILIFLQPSL